MGERTGRSAASGLSAAQASFNAVYGQVPGELAPKLALALACERGGEDVIADPSTAPVRAPTPTTWRRLPLAWHESGPPATTSPARSRPLI